MSCLKNPLWFCEIAVIDLWIIGVKKTKTSETKLLVKTF